MRARGLTINVPSGSLHERVKVIHLCEVAELRGTFDIEITSALFEPGIVERHSQHSRSWFAVGSIDPATESRLGEVTALLEHVGNERMPRTSAPPNG